MNCKICGNDLKTKSDIKTGICGKCMYERQKSYFDNDPGRKEIYAKKRRERANTWFGDKHWKTTHGMFGTKLYWIRNSMKDRCRNKNNKAYKYYGGRGIKIQKSWYNFKKFYNDMGESRILLIEKLGKDVSLERVDVSKGYCKENCIWIDKSEQTNNRSNTIYIDYIGERKTLRDWCLKLGINYKVANSKYKKYGNIGDYVFKSRRDIKVVFDGNVLTLKEIIKKTHHTHKTLYEMIKEGKLQTV